jgi:menaquinone-9 beta-reductase
MEHVTVLIIGGGPGGLSTALHLVRLDPQFATRILILEKEHYPRPKLCAGGLVADAEIILKRLGLDVSEIPHVDVEAAHFDFAGRGLKIRPWKSYAFRIIRRNEFDAWLAGKARDRGIEIREGITIKDVRPDNEGVTVETDQGFFRAQIVVGADGSNGVTRKCIFPDEPLQTARLLEIITTENGIEKTSHGKHDAYFDFIVVPQNIAGYTWDFPTQVKGQPMRCWGIYDTNILADQKRPALKDPLAKEMARQGFDLNEYEVKGHPIRWFEPWKSISVPHVLLVGDAAGADSLFGEGISMALGYGAIAAQEITDSFRRGEFSFRGYKFRLARSSLGQALFARWFIASIIYPLKWAWFQILLWRIMKPIVIIVAWIFVLNWSKRLK